MECLNIVCQSAQREIQHGRGPYLSVLGCICPDSYVLLQRYACFCLRLWKDSGGGVGHQLNHILNAAPTMAATGHWPQSINDRTVPHP